MRAALMLAALSLVLWAVPAAADLPPGRPRPAPTVLPPPAQGQPAAPTSAAASGTPGHAERSASAPPGPTELRIPGKAGQLQAFLWKPAGPGPFPAVVYNHGSEQQPIAGTRAHTGAFFAAHGYAVLFPYRRGTGASEGKYWRDRVASILPFQQEQRAVDALVEENDDVVSAIEWLRAQPFVARDEIAVAGCSFGGIESLLTGERTVPGLRAVVDFAGGAMSWKGSAKLRARMQQAAESARVPVFFVQAENDFDTTPSRVLSEAMRKKKLPNRMQIFPPFGSSNMEGHARFCNFGDSVWGDAVLDFLKHPR